MTQEAAVGANDVEQLQRRIEVNLDELDRIIDRGTNAPLSKADGQKIKAALHAMAENSAAAGGHRSCVIGQVLCLAGR